MSLPTLEQIAEGRKAAREMREGSDKKRLEASRKRGRTKRQSELTATETVAAEELRKKKWEIGHAAGVKYYPQGQQFGGGVKHDAEKLRVDLLPVDVLKGVAGILTHGAKKYGDRNWEAGIKYSRLYGATLRHLFAFWHGEDIDPESKLRHLDHALCELMFLRAMSTRKPELDDRPKERG